VIQIPIMLYVLRYPPHIATATTHFVTMMTCAAALIPHLILGNIQVNEAWCMGIGVIGGAQLGARFARHISPKAVVCLYNIVLLVFACRLLFFN
jgi:uncharacterized membrane protein YfcA